MPGLIGKKIGMTSLYTEEGKYIPVTVIEAGPCVVTQVKTIEKDGYSAVQLAFEDKKEKHCTKALSGHFKKSNTAPKSKLVEFEGFDSSVKLGDVFTAGLFTTDDLVDVRGKTKGKGFQGVIRRHNFSGVGGATHGQHNRLRAPGSMGASSFPSRVWRGKRMAGHLGNESVKIIDLRVVKIVPENNIVMIKGAVPGSIGSYVIIEK
jgi:large subunit ribosomal protein L3